jgi:hypothetical protein
MTMSREIAQYARDYERMAGREIPYSEMVCNQFVLAVLRATVAPRIPNMRADEFANSPLFQKVDSPNAGDLVHWPGHIGVVLDPDHGIFIGSQSSTGVAESNFKSGWWSGAYAGKKPDYFLRFIG